MKMATIKSVMYTFAIFLSLSVVLAEDASTTSPKSFPGLPNFPSIPGFSGSGFPSFQGIPNFSSMIPTLPSFTGSRQRRQADTTEASAEDSTHDHQERLFFTTLFSTYVTGCNFTTNPGKSCASCTQTLTCFSGNVGLRQNCHGLFRFCNNGHCSLNRGAACDATTSTSTSTSTTSTTSTTTTTTTPATGG